MKNRIIVARSLLLVGVAGAVALGAFSATAQARRPGGGGPGGCVCPLYYAPVECDNGRTYSNICFANCNNATGCVPVGPGPVPL